jgi:hypothetical protein
MNLTLLAPGPVEETALPANFFADRLLLRHAGGRRRRELLRPVDGLLA